jgi:undecaprenyl diphosphate synthase
MQQRTLPGNGIHVGIIMDGNGRWARLRRRPRPIGHRRGARAVRAVVEAAADPALGIDALTLYAFSSGNWARPRAEVTALMGLLEEYLRSEVPRCVENGVRLRVAGRRDRLSAALVEAIREAEEATANGSGLLLRLAIDYSSRSAIVRAAARAAARGELGMKVDEAGFATLLAEVDGHAEAVRDVDLLIRTGGEQRLSDFLLWECAYAELFFTPVLWPDFGAEHLAAAVSDFAKRERRFGRVMEEAV